MMLVNWITNKLKMVGIGNKKTIALPPVDPNTQAVDDIELDAVDLPVSDCTWPYTWLYAMQNGEVKPCCYAPNPIGMLQDVDSIIDIWNSKEMDELRVSIYSNKVHRICAGASCHYVKTAIPREVLDKHRVYSDPIEIELVPERTRRLAWLGRPLSLCLLGEAYFARGDFSAAKLWLERAAKANQPSAGVILAHIFIKETGENELPKSIVDYLLMGVKAHYEPAYSALALQYLFGAKSTGKDIDKAEELLKVGASKRDPYSFYYLGLLYAGEYGSDTWTLRPDLSLSKHYFKQAEKLGVDLGS